MASRLSRAIEAGEELLRLLQSPPEATDWEAVERLLQERGRLLQEVAQAVEADPRSAPAKEEVDRLTAQQRALQEQAGQILKVLSGRSGDARAARAAMQNVTRLLSGVRSRFVDERR